MKPRCTPASSWHSEDLPYEMLGEHHYQMGGHMGGLNLLQDPLHYDIVLVNHICWINPQLLLQLPKGWIFILLFSQVHSSCQGKNEHVLLPSISQACIGWG